MDRWEREGYIDMVRLSKFISMITLVGPVVWTARILYFPHWKQPSVILLQD